MTAERMITGSVAGLAAIEQVPADVPAAQFWDVTVYDVQTRSLLQTDYPYPGVTSMDKTVFINADGTADVFFGPKKPEGNVNWI